eukprot:gene18706-22333_t
MSSTLRTPQLVTKEVAATSFGFYGAAEVKRISCKRISNPLLYDPLGNPVADGLYDPALGPTENHVSCTTCCLSYAHCAGHFGHVELCMPVYNPLVFGTVVKLMRATCTNCYKFKMSADRVAQYSTKFAHLATGRLIEALAVDTAPRGVGISKELTDFLAEGHVASTEQDAASTGQEKKPKAASPGPRKPLTQQVQMAIGQVIREFFLNAMRDNCENCKAKTPKMHFEGDGQLFWVPLSKKNRMANALHKSAPDPERKLLLGEQADASDEEDVDGGAPDPSPKFLTPSQVKDIMDLLWKNERQFLELLWGCEGVSLQGGSTGVGTGFSAPKSPHIFFIQSLLVTPNRFRPPSKVGDVVSEHAQNTALIAILEANGQLVELTHRYKHDPTAAFPLDEAARKWNTLQQTVNNLLDNTKARKSDNVAPGIRQQLEKKEGLFRKNMMGKRVNFACRSVISPDPYIATDEIGVPPHFATRLSFPEVVTGHNLEEMRRLVETGATAHPGANAVEDEKGRIIQLERLSLKQRQSISKTLLSVSSAGLGGGDGNAAKFVYRHLKDGDLVLVNRQPTLHKPGIMAHRVKVLKGQRTIRMHYANCKTYNADFDGDEMNVHFPQDYFGRAEAAEIVAADQQFWSPTDGKPLRGLIQDHVVAGVLLTKRDTFLERADFMQLVYWATMTARPAAVRGRTQGIGLEPTIQLPVPAVLRPRPLWTGKQVISVLLGFLGQELPTIYLSAGTATPAEYWGGKQIGESDFRVFGNDLVTGVLDKAAFGKFGLMHAVQELHGCKAAGRLLSSFSRLFTGYLQMHGFTCGMEDLRVTPEADVRRSFVLEQAEGEVRQVAYTFARMTVEEMANESSIRNTLGARLRSRPQGGAELDMASSGAVGQ